VIRRRVEFDLLSAWAGLRLRAGRGEPGPAAGPIVSTVARVPADVTLRLRASLEEMAARWPEHYHYPLETIHMTVLTLAVPPESARPQAWREALCELVESEPSFEVTARGFGVSPETVFVQLFPHGPVLGRVRRRLGALADPTAPPRRQSHPLLRSLFFGHLAFANVVRFRGPVDTGLLDFVAARRRVDVARFTVREVELVVTDKLFSRAGTTVLERCALPSR
jgi:hypothetical protein